MVTKAENEALKLVHENKDILFTFKEEAKNFLIRNKLNYIYQEADLIDDECFKIIGYNSRIYWIG